MPGPYGTQSPPMPGQAVLGYGPSGQVYTPDNPVYMTPGGMRPGNAAGVGGTAAPTGPYAAPAYQNAPQRPYAWTAPGKQLAAMEQARYGTNFYGGAGNLPTGGSQTPGTGQISNGITSGSVSPAAIARGVATFGQGGQAPGVPVSPAAYGTMQNQYAGLMGQGLNTAALDFARNAAFQSADMNLAQQRARGDAGLGWGNLMARLSELNTNGQNQQDAMLQSLLMGLIG